MAVRVQRRADSDAFLEMVPERSWLQRQWGMWRKKPIGLASLIIIVGLLFVAILGPVLATHSPIQNDMTKVLHGPSSEHFFGTDQNGRDVYSRVTHGARVSLIVGFSVVLIGITAGSVIGLVSAFSGGKIDFAIQRMIDALMAIPGLVLLMAIVSVLDPSIPNLILAIGIFIIPPVVRVVRGEVLVARETDYVLAAAALGAAGWRIMIRHILPNIGAPILIIASVTVGQAILIEASLSFLGLGVPPPHPTWGNMLSGPGRQYMSVAPWLVIAPGIAITITILSFNMLGDALRDILDPRLRGQ